MTLLQVYDVLNNEGQLLEFVVRVASPAFPKDKLESEVSNDWHRTIHGYLMVSIPGGHHEARRSEHNSSSSKCTFLGLVCVQPSWSGIYDNAEGGQFPSMQSSWSSELIDQMKGVSAWDIWDTLAFEKKAIAARDTYAAPN